MQPETALEFLERFFDTPAGQIFFGGTALFIGALLTIIVALVITNHKARIKLGEMADRVITLAGRTADNQTKLTSLYETTLEKIEAELRENLQIVKENRELLKEIKDTLLNVDNGV